MSAGVNVPIGRHDMFLDLDPAIPRTFHKSLSSKLVDQAESQMILRQPWHLVSQIHHSADTTVPHVHDRVVNLGGVGKPERLSFFRPGGFLMKSIFLRLRAGQSRVQRRLQLVGPLKLSFKTRHDNC